MRINLLCLLLLCSCVAFGQGTGEVIITEIHNRPLKPSDEQLAAALPNNPAGADETPNEGHTEWFEVYNTTDAPVVMDGWLITDASGSGETEIGSFTIEANSYAVFAGFNIPAAQGGVEFDYFYNYKDPSFNNESSYADAGDDACPDGVILTNAAGELVDEVLYDYGYGEYIGNPEAGSCVDNETTFGLPPQNGSSKTSFMLNVDPAVMNSADNDLADNWSYSTITYDEAGSQKGTPGMQNDGMDPTDPPVGGTGSGEVIITEIHNRPLKPSDEQLAAALPNNPAGADETPNEGHTEWFEVYNTTNEAVVMDGWLITDASGSGETEIGSFTIEANSYAVFSGFNIPAAQGGVEFDYFYNYKDPSFNNESSYADAGDDACPDGVILSKADGSLVDEVRYDYGYGEYIGNPDSDNCMTEEVAIGLPPQEGSSKVSFMLNVDPAVMNSADNDLPENWSYSTITYDEAGSQIGTPGLRNDGMLPPGPTEPGSGEVIITEIYNRPLKPSDEQLAAALPNNPAGADETPNEGHTEWFEVYNTTDAPVVMDGWTLTDASSSGNFTVIGSFTIEANSYAVFSGFNIPDAQGGIEFDYFYDYKKPSFNNESSYADPGDTSCPDGVVITKADGSLVDEVRYDYGYGEYIGNPDSEFCLNNTTTTNIPAAGSSSKVSFMLNVDPAVMNSADNNLAANWSFSTYTYDEAGSQVGTPGLRNDHTTSVKEDILSQNVRVSPNPASTLINIVSDLDGTFTGQLYDVTGRNILNTQISDRRVDISEVPVGIYWLKLTLEGSSTVKKIVVQR